MKFLTDENIATSVVYALRHAGFDVKDIKEEKLFGVSDKEILQLASKENRIIITHDKDFAQILSSAKISHKGVILLRLKNQNPTNVAQILLKTLQSQVAHKIPNNLSVLSEAQTVIHQQAKS